LPTKKEGIPREKKKRSISIIGGHRALSWPGGGANYHVKQGIMGVGKKRLNGGSGEIIRKHFNGVGEVIDSELGQGGEKATKEKKMNIKILTGYKGKMKDKLKRSTRNG